MVKQEICQTCDCNVKEKILNCANQNLFKLFDAKDWDTVISANKSASLANVEYVLVFIILLSISISSPHE